MKAFKKKKKSHCINYLLLVSTEYENRGEENSPKKRSESHCLFNVEKQREEISVKPWTLSLSLGFLGTRQKRGIWKKHEGLGVLLSKCKAFVSKCCSGLLFRKNRNHGRVWVFESVLWNALRFLQIYLFSNWTIGIRLEKLSPVKEE